MKLGTKIVSPAVFVGILVMLASVDERVRDRFSAVVMTGDGLTPWGHRLGDLIDAFVSAVRYQSVENAPMLIFTAVGAVLVVFMLRT